MQTIGDQPTILSVNPVTPAAPNGIVVRGQHFEVGQNHLLEPFLSLVGAVEQMAAVAAGGIQNGAAEESCIRRTYCSIYDFFRAFLPTASHEAVDGLSYSIALLLVGEAIEAGRIVVTLPARSQDPRRGCEASALPFASAIPPASSPSERTEQ